MAKKKQDPHQLGSGIDVIKLLPNDRAIISTKGLVRLISGYDGSTLGELVSFDTAKVYSETSAGCHASGVPTHAAIEYRRLYRAGRRK